MKRFLLCAGIQSTVVREEGVYDYCLLHLGDGLQASGIEYSPISSVSQRNTILTALEGIDNNFHFNDYVWIKISVWEIENVVP